MNLPHVERVGQGVMSYVGSVGMWAVKSFGLEIFSLGTRTQRFPLA